MNTYEISGHNDCDPTRERGVYNDLGTVEAKTARGALIKANRMFRETHSDVYVTLVQGN